MFYYRGNLDDPLRWINGKNTTFRVTQDVTFYEANGDYNVHSLGSYVMESDGMTPIAFNFPKIGMGNTYEDAPGCGIYS